MGIYYSTPLGGGDIKTYFQAPFTGSTNTTLTGYQNNGGSISYVTFSVGTKLANSGYQQSDVDISTILQPLAGEYLYTTAGTYTWTCPSDVYYICILAIGSGGGAQRNIGSTGYPGTAGNLSKFVNGATTIVQANGGGRGIPGAAGAGGTTTGTTGYVGYTGGAGGYAAGNGNGGGGGAAGYSGVGGVGGSTSAPGAGSGGGAGGGGSQTFGNFSGSGGGVGVYGQGSNGAAGTNNSTAASVAAAGKGGSGGDNGNTGLNNLSGGTYGGGCFTYNGTVSSAYGGGGGGGLAYINNYAVTPGNTYTVTVGAPGQDFNAGGVVQANGGGGTVRILWGNGRSFPSTQLGTAFNQTLI